MHPPGYVIVHLSDPAQVYIIIAAESAEVSSAMSRCINSIAGGIRHVTFFAPLSKQFSQVTLLYSETIKQNGHPGKIMPGIGSDSNENSPV